MNGMSAHPLRNNLLILLGYSVAFMIIGEWVDIIGIHWFTLVAHTVVLFILGRKDISIEGRKPFGKQKILAGVMVLLVGHGLCFFNGLLHFNVH
ncbi:MAG: hypothetical protein IPN85_02845 [Flavobacteriales bacterium]|nr:hypothetical protein [Flavobacteriales bacterium]MBK9287163.1 hypothetical protein [Flavobacteriales bacterium]MBL0034226.1 hypothetical protein [Flavobacteriales bacterium]